MASAKNPPTASDEELLDCLSGRWEQIRAPGYWTNIAQNCETWATEISGGPFWKSASTRLDQWRTEYRAQTGADLLVQSELPRFRSKPELSIREKIVRRLRENQFSINEIFQSEGQDVPAIGDLVRTRISCRYIDGVEFLASKILNLAKEMNLRPVVERQGSIEGYYAQHVNVSQDVIYRFGGVSKLTVIECEVQLASEMATRMWDASHPLYERVRNNATLPDDWQWRPHDARFISNQLGHVIHLADGLLVQLRDRRLGRKEMP